MANLVKRRPLEGWDSGSSPDTETIKNKEYYMPFEKVDIKALVDREKKKSLAFRFWWAYYSVYYWFVSITYRIFKK